MFVPVFLDWPSSPGNSFLLEDRNGVRPVGIVWLIHGGLGQGEGLLRPMLAMRARTMVICPEFGSPHIRIGLTLVGDELKSIILDSLYAVSPKMLSKVPR